MKFDENLNTKTTLVSVYKFSLRLENFLLMEMFIGNLDLEWNSWSGKALCENSTSWSGKQIPLQENALGHETSMIICPITGYSNSGSSGFGGPSSGGSSFTAVPNQDGYGSPNGPALDR